MDKTGGEDGDHRVGEQLDPIELLEILQQHKDLVSYTLSFNNPEMLTIKFKDGTEIVLCEHIKQNLKK